MGEVIKFTKNDIEAIYKTKEILCDFSEEIRKKILVEKDPDELEHLKMIYELIPTAQFILGYAWAARNPR